MDIKAIIFDLGGTLIEYTGSFASWPELETPGLQAAYTSLHEGGVILPDFDTFRSAGFKILPDRWQMATQGQRNLRLIDFLEEVTAACDVKNVDHVQLDEAAHLYEAAICAQALPLDAAEETLSLVREQGYKMGLLSNTMFTGQAHVADLKRFSLDGYFDAMLFSADAGKWKPSAEPYLDLLEQLQVEPEHAIFVGDDPANDMVGGKSAGLRTVLMRSSHRFHVPDHVRPDTVIFHLNELPVVLNEWSNE
ncbi:MAG: HAD family hydrolase [Candidatus Promineifilaceae bacterium]|nr:HAD family hydrolase [Candidatus Promineifilaceae bacterium]